PDTPAAIVVRATWPDEKLIATTVGRLAEDLAFTGARTTVLVLVGPALGAQSDRQDGQGGDPPQRSHLYSPRYAHLFRRRSLPGSTRGRPARMKRTP
ncbi:MAG: hypothetical protein ACRD1G_11050, partial [Acidimicrobiales bacterium]